MRNDKTGRVAVVGASGNVGSALMAYLVAQDLDVVGTYFSRERPGLVRLDITDPDAVNLFLSQYTPRTVIWLAGSKDVKRCEQDGQYAFGINTAPVEKLCQSISSRAPTTRLLFISTDYVFDGTSGKIYDEGAPTHPLTNYGRSNLAAETAVLRDLPCGYVIRTSAMVGRGFSFFDWLRGALLSGRPVEAYKNIIFTPTPALLFHSTMLALAIGQCEPTLRVLHVVGNEFMSRYVFACRLARILKVDECIISAVDAPKDTLFQPNLSLRQSAALTCLPRVDLDRFLESEAGGIGPE